MRDGACDDDTRPAVLDRHAIRTGRQVELTLLFEVSAHRRTILEAFRYLSLHFFAPGYQYFLVGVLSAGPFVICAVFLLLHLGWNDRLQPAQFSRRLAGVLGSLILMFGVSFWTHLSALMHPDAQGALVSTLLGRASAMKQAEAILAGQVRTVALALGVMFMWQSFFAPKDQPKDPPATQGSAAGSAVGSSSCRSTKA